MDFIVDFICGFYGFHMKSHLIPYERSGESEESHLNQLFLLISGGFHEIHQISVKSARFHEIHQISVKSTRFQCEICRILV